MPVNRKRLKYYECWTTMNRVQVQGSRMKPLTKSPIVWSWLPSSNSISSSADDSNAKLFIVVTLSGILIFLIFVSENACEEKTINIWWVLNNDERSSNTGRQNEITYIAFNFLKLAAIFEHNFLKCWWFGCTLTNNFHTFWYLDLCDLWPKKCLWREND